MDEADVVALIPILCQYINLQGATAGLIMRKLQRRRQLLSVMRKKLEKSKRTRGTAVCHRGIVSTGLLGQILAGNESATVDNLHVSANALRLLVRKIGAKSHGWGVKIEAIIFLFWLASGFDYKTISAALDIPRTTMYRAVNKMLDRAVRQVGSEIYCPQQEEVEELNDGFAELSKSAIFGICAGALSTKYVHGTQDQCVYFIRLQILTDHVGNIIDMFVSSKHMDPFTNSTLFTEGEYPPKGNYIVATNEYPCMTGDVPIVTPFVEPANNIEILFNKHQKKAQNISEKTVAMMEVRWPLIFQKKQVLLNAEKCIKVIAACGVIHNVCMRAGDVCEVTSERSWIGDTIDMVEDREGGSDLRACLIDRLTRELRKKKQR